MLVLTLILIREVKPERKRDANHHDEHKERDDSEARGFGVALLPRHFLGKQSLLGGVEASRGQNVLHVGRLPRKLLSLTPEGTYADTPFRTYIGSNSEYNIKH
jgi:hypothetical protein